MQHFQTEENYLDSSVYEEQYKSLFDVIDDSLEEHIIPSRFEELQCYVICIGEGLRARITNWFDTEEKFGSKMSDLVKGRIRTFISVESPELEDLLSMTGDVSTLLFVNTVEECEALMKLALDDVKACPSHVFIGGFFEDYDLKCEAARKSDIVSHHQVIPMDNNKALTKILCSVLLPPRLEFLDLSFIEPILHVQTPFPVKN